MNVTFHYFAQVRRAAGTGRETIEVPAGATLATAVQEIVQHHGPVLGNLICDEAGHVRPSLLVLLNGIPVLRNPSQALKEGDAISLMSAIAGG